MSGATVRQAVFGNTGKAIAVAALCVCAGLGAWIAMMSLGLATTTAMGNIFNWGLLIAVFAFLVGFGAGSQLVGNIFNWGLLIAVFAFLVGFGAGSQLVASGIVLFGREESQRLVLPLQACGLGGAIGAAVAVLADLGSPLHIVAMLLHPNPASPLVWDMVALTAFIVLAFGAIGAAVAVLADLGSPLHIVAMLLHPNPASPLVWDMVALTAFIVLAFVGLLAVARGWRSRRAWMAVAGVAAVALQVVEGLLFALMGARAWWHSVLEPVDFLVVALVCGLTLAVLLGVFSKYSDGLGAAVRMARWLWWWPWYAA